MSDQLLVTSFIVVVATIWGVPRVIDNVARLTRTVEAFSHRHCHRGRTIFGHTNSLNYRIKLRVSQSRFRTRHQNSPLFTNSRTTSQELSSQ